GTAAQAGAAPASVRLVVAQGAAVHRSRGREQVGDAATLAVAAAPLGQVVVDRAVADGDDAGAQRPEVLRRGVVVPQVVEDAAPRAETGEDGPGAAGRVAVATARLVVVQLAAADTGRTSCV